MQGIFNSFSSLLWPSKALKDFPSLTRQEKLTIIALTILTTILTAGLATIPLFNYLVGRFKRIEDSKIEKISIDKIDLIARQVLFSDQEPIQTKTSNKSTITKVCRKKLEEILAIKNQRYIETSDEGDCFYDAFAVGLLSHGKTINFREEKLNEAFRAFQNQTPEEKLQNLDKIQYLRRAIVRELRYQVKNEIDLIHQQDPDNNWVKQTYASFIGEIDSYEDYKKYVGDDIIACLKKGRSPIWGRGSIEGTILCRLYRIGLNIGEVGVGIIDDEHLGNLINPQDKFNYLYKNVYFGDGDLYPRQETFEQKIEMAVYPGHFLAIVPATSPRT
jgi:hypothetical protein